MAAIALALLSGSLAVPTAQAKELPGPAESYLFTVDSSNVKVIPGKDHAGKIVIDNPDAIRWSDRPYRHALDISVQELLREFGWSPKTLRLAADTPNASVSVAGHSEIVDIRKVRKQEGRLVLFVRSIDGPLTAASGPGSVVIDNVILYPVAQTQAADAVHTFTATLTSPTALTVDLYENGNKTASVTFASEPDSFFGSVLQATLPIPGSPEGAALPAYIVRPGYSNGVCFGVAITISSPTLENPLHESLVVGFSFGP